jgi:hypothetical protein
LISSSQPTYANLAEAVNVSLRGKTRFQRLEARYRTPAGEERTLDITVSSVHAAGGVLLRGWPGVACLGVACLISNDRTEVTEIRRQQELRGEMSTEMALGLPQLADHHRGLCQQARPAATQNWRGSWRPTSQPRQRT